MSVRARIAEEAAEWFVTNRGGAANDLQRAAFASWLRTSPLHIEEYLGVALIARDLRDAADPGVALDELVAQARRTEETQVRRIGTDRPSRAAERSGGTRWRFAVTMVSALAAAAVAGLWWNAERVVQVRYATRHGELITERLADNSVLHLDTDSAVTVRYDRRQRLVELERGRAFFEVAHEPARPFQVRAGYAIARAAGTRFGVYLQPGSTLITVIEGQVLVGVAPEELEADASRRLVPVSAGQQLAVVQGSLPAAAAPADVRRATGWLRREIVFEREPLAAVAAEFSRYAPLPIVIETPELGALQVSGVFSIDDTESFVAFLRSLDGVSVEVTRTSIRVSRM